MSKEERDLERDYRRERSRILEDPRLSWERKMMREVKQLFARYSSERDKLRGAASEAEDGAA